MTAIARQPCLRAALLAGCLLASLASARADGVALPPLPSLPDVGEMVVMHDTAGIAIHGFDPVAYFAQGRAIGGSEAHELQHAGVVWRFRSAANRRAFASDPSAYMPLFGGHDPTGLRLGRSVDASPEIFLIHENQLLLFRNAENREAFASQPMMLQEAALKWSAAQAQLAR